jgi:phosphomannomutase
MSGVEQKAYVSGADSINTLDGIRLDFGHSWMLVRASGTEPAIRIIAEAPSASEAQELLNKGNDMIQPLVRI